LIALVGGVLIGLVLIARAEPGQRRSTGMPFGPALALGGLVALFVGPALVSAYLRHFA
jgi:leader peptidase (prepilin peptidase)/N-methyltransferase